MTCYHPLKGFIRGINKDTGKKDLIITSYETDHIEISGSRVMHIASKKIQAEDVMNTRVIEDYVTIPCAQCIGCRIDKSREWANRMMFELEYHKKACFITLTYNDENIPWSEYVNDEGEICPSMTLVKKDFQLFLKRLRKEIYPQKVRYYACGEYGDKTKRPHFHAIIYGINFDFDRYQYGKSEDGYPQYRSPTLEKVWTYGYSMICNVEWQTCAYVARYVTKKKKGLQKDYYEYFNIEPEFSLMSLKPGIGYQWYMDNKERMYKFGHVWLSKGEKAIRARPPAYFDKLYDIESHEEMEKIKKARKRIAEEEKKKKLYITGKTYIEMLHDEELNFKARISSLKRKGV